jgi:hypothetical protein
LDKDPPDRGDYRRRAAELLRASEDMKEPEQRRILLTMAAIYHRLADTFEEK